MTFKIGFASNINDVKEVEIRNLEDLVNLENTTRLKTEIYGLYINFKEQILVIDDNNTLCN